MEIYKYRNLKDLGRDIKSLKNNMIYASKFTHLNDPFEAIFDEQITNIELLQSTFSYDSSRVIKSFEDISMYKSRLGICSFSQTYSDELMWAHYADSYNGLCIEYDLEELKSLYLNPLTVLVCEVDYKLDPPIISYEDIDNDTLIQKLFATKSLRWEYEKEIRFIFDTSSLKEHPPKALISICFGLKISQKTRRQIINALKKLDVIFYEIYQEPDTYKLKRRLISEEFINSSLRKRSFLRKEKENVSSTANNEKLYKTEWRLPVDNENIHLGKILIENRIKGKGEYYVKKNSETEYLTACSPRVNDWEYYLINTQTRKIESLKNESKRKLKKPRLDL